MSARTDGFVVGLDVGLGVLQRNQEYYSDKIQFVNSLASGLPFRDASFDMVFSVAVIHHLPFEVQQRALEEIQRVLKPGKHFFVIESVETDSRSDHLFPRTFEGWGGLLEEHEFRILDSVGQEYIDFRRIIRPVRRAARKLATSMRRRNQDLGVPSSRDGDGGGGPRANAAQLSRLQRLVHLPFLPLVLASYPLEIVLSRWGKRRWANYACLLARKNADRRSSEH
jgi:SAM-dependent methyltransferase